MAHVIKLRRLSRLQRRQKDRRQHAKDMQAARFPKPPERQPAKPPFIPPPRVLPDIEPLEEFIKTCFQCFSDVAVDLDTYIDPNRFTCEPCILKQVKKREAEAVIKRARQQALATPTWADLDAIKNVYDQARAKSIATGIPHEVDHIIPIQSDVVCGLHIAVNLRIITQRENRQKHNKLIAI